MTASFTLVDRRRLASSLHINEQYLYQCLTGRRDMNPAQARRLERRSGGELMRWHLCQSTWFEIWPEMADLEGAPPVPVDIACESADSAHDGDVPPANARADVRQ